MHFVFGIWNFTYCDYPFSVILKGNHLFLIEYKYYSTKRRQLSRGYGNNQVKS